jgi:hypothetical protein
MRRLAAREHPLSATDNTHVRPLRALLNALFATAPGSDPTDTEQVAWLYRQANAYTAADLPGVDADGLRYLAGIARQQAQRIKQKGANR